MKRLNLIIIFCLSNTLNSVEMVHNLLSHFNKKDFKFLLMASYNPKLLEDYLYRRYEVVPANFEYLKQINRTLISLLNIPQSCLGQKDDIELITQAINNCNQKIIGVGIETGAATWINAAANNANISKIKALVLESPFANANEIIYSVSYLKYLPGGEFIAKKIAKFILPKYDPEGVQPIESIKNISNKNLPIFIIHSKADNIISINHSRRLYLEFLKYGFTNVYLIEAKHATHNEILNNIDYRIYQKTLHAFYKKFNIPFNEQLAKNINIGQYQPDIETINDRLDIYSFNNVKPLIFKTLILLFITYKCFKRFPIISKTINIFINYISRIYLNRYKGFHENFN